MYTNSQNEQKLHVKLAVSFIVFGSPSVATCMALHMRNVAKPGVKNSQISKKDTLLGLPHVGQSIEVKQLPYAQSVTMHENANICICTTSCRSVNAGLRSPLYQLVTENLVSSMKLFL